VRGPALILAGVALGVVMLYAGLIGLRPYIDRTYGLYLNIDPPNSYELLMLGSIVLAGIAAGLLPAIRAYRLSLADGMTVKV
jgi:putative ABC transport system permease protein